MQTCPIDQELEVIGNAHIGNIYLTLANKLYKKAEKEGDQDKKDKFYAKAQKTEDRAHAKYEVAQ